MISLSNRGYPMLRTFAEGGSNYHMTIAEAAHFDQRPFRSMLIRGYIAWRPSRGFHLTPKGREAWAEFQTTAILRSEKLWSRPLTAYFDPTAYGLTKPPARVESISRTGAA